MTCQHPFRYIFIIVLLCSLVLSGYSDSLAKMTAPDVPDDQAVISLDEPDSGQPLLQNETAATDPGQVVPLVSGILNESSGDQANRAGSSKSTSYADSELIVQFSPASSSAQRNTIHTKMGSQVVKDYGSLGAPGLQVVALSPGLSVPDAKAQYDKNPVVVDSQPNFIRNLSAAPVIPNDPGYANQWGMNIIDAPEAWVYGTGSSSIIVAVIDTGVDYNHPDLAANIFINPGETGTDSLGRDNRTNGVDDDGNGFVDDWRGWDFVGTGDNDPYDDHSHGTHCAGVIGAIGNNGYGVVGVNWNVRILPLKCFNYEGKGYDDDIIEAFLYAKMMGVNITSNSYSGSDYDSVLESTINESGMLNVFAAGNEGRFLSPAVYPACYPGENIIAVAATDQNDQLASFSNYHPTFIDLAAPGVSIYSTVPGGFLSMGGTSMATPHVAAAAALIMSVRPDLTPLQVKEVILDSVEKKASLDGKVLTGGRLNLANAVRSVEIEESSPTLIGVYQNGTWYLDRNGDRIYNGGDANFSYGAPGWEPVTGNWDGNTSTEIGVYRNGTWHLDVNGDGNYTAEDANFSFGLAGWQPVTGDWSGNGSARVGVYRDGVWYLDLNGNGTFEAGDVRYAFGMAGWIPVLGDWSGTGQTRIGVYRDGIWYLDLNGNGFFDAGDVRYAFGMAGWTPVLGDWSGTGQTRIGVYRDGIWYLDLNGNGFFDTEDAGIGYGGPGWSGVSGEWKNI